MKVFSTQHIAQIAPDFDYSTYSDLPFDLNYLTNLDENVLHIYDVFDQKKFNFLTKYSTPKYIVVDHYTNINFRLPIYCAPMWLANQIENFKCESQLEITNHNTFNFMINKKLLHRSLCIRLIEMFELTDYDYTWSGIGRFSDMSDILDELNQLGTNSPLTKEQQAFILGPIEIESKFFNKYEESNNDSSPPMRYNLNRDGNYSYADIHYAWEQFLKNMFASSAVSLITESHGSMDLESAAFTEKTAFAVLGLNFPIWIGGHNQAEEWKKLGFDVFDDVIDHSYQSRSTLVERCYYAIADNLKILSNRDFAHELRFKYLDRLNANRELLLNKHLTKQCRKIISSWPTDLQQAMPEILKRFKYIPAEN